MKPFEAEQRLVEVIRLRHLAKATEDCYVAWLRRFMRFLVERRPTGTTEQKLEAFLTQLAKQDVAATTQNQAFNALVFFYREAMKQPLGDIRALRAKRPAMIRTAPEVDEVRALLAGLPVALPGLLAKKYPDWRFAWKWAWLFPAHAPCRHPRTDETVRWRCHEANVQRAVRQAARPLGLCVTPHHLRHAYATHSLNRGVNVKALQLAMGHAHSDTTLGYCHASALSVPSPLEAFA